MSPYKRCLLALIAFIPIPSISFAAQEETSFEAPAIEQPSERVMELFDAGYFSPGFYDTMANLGIQKGVDLQAATDPAVVTQIRNALKSERFEYVRASGPTSPT